MAFLQVASWNIEHLSGAARRDRKQSAFALADHIEMSGIDLIALQEIYLTPADEKVRLGENQPPIKSGAVTARRNADLDIVCYLLKEHLGTPWKYIILPNRSEGDTSQLCAAMWNTGRLVFDKATAIKVEHKSADGPLWDRKPHLVSFTSDRKAWRKDSAGKWVKVADKTRFNFVPLHMKSNYGGATKNRPVRAREAQTLCKALKGMKHDPSLMLIGDTNILDNAEPAIETLVDYGFVDLNNNDSSTYWSPQFAGAPFDRAFVAPKRPEFKYTRQYVMKSSDLEAHDRLLSDHYMIKVSVKDYLDDSDPRPN